MTDSEPPSESGLEDARGVIEQLERYISRSRAGDAPVVGLEPLPTLLARMDPAGRIERGQLSGGELTEFLARYLDATARVHHPGSMAHQVAVPDVRGAAIGALVDAVTNNPMSIYEMGPAATALERAVVNWMLRKIGWVPESDEAGARSGGGVLTHGGSLANLTGLIAARSRAAPDVWQEGNPPGLAIFASPLAHFSISRAACILGLGRRAVLPAPVDERGVIDPERLEAAHDRARRDGWAPIALVANACSTAVGLYDPLEPIGQFCRSRGLWLHVDGAHGASALLSPRTRHRLRGVEMADSLSWDAHKLLRVPSLCAALLVRDRTSLHDDSKQEASYLFHEKEQPGVDLIARAFECTKSGLGLRLFMVLASLGEQRLGAYVERTFEVAANACRMISERPGFSCAVAPDANIVCFRYGAGDDRQLRIRDALIADGEFHLSATEYLGHRYLRLCVMNPATDESVIGRLLDRIESLVRSDGRVRRAS